jgi:hypothetical protein
MRVWMKINISGVGRILKKKKPPARRGFLLSQPDVRPKGFEPLTF